GRPGRTECAHSRPGLIAPDLRICLAWSVCPTRDREEEPAGLGIEEGCPCPRDGGDRRERLVAVGVVLPDHRNGPVAARDIDPTSLRVEVQVLDVPGDGPPGHGL